MKQIGAPDPSYKELMMPNSEVAGTLPLTGVANGSIVHIVDTGVIGRFYEGHWYDFSGGTVIK